MKKYYNIYNSFMKISLKSESMKANYNRLWKIYSEYITGTNVKY